MKEKKLNKVDVAMKWFEVGTYIVRAIGVLLLFMMAIVIIEGIQRFNKDVMMVEMLNMVHAGESNPRPATGIAYDLEARVITDDGNSMWYHDAISANIGDLIEVRLKVTPADHIDTGCNIADKHFSMKFTEGLSALTVQEESERIICSDETFANHPDGCNGECVAYIELGTYKLGIKDWISGKNISGFLAYIDGDATASLMVVWPYCEVNILLAIFLFVGALVCGSVLPFIITHVEYRIIRYLNGIY